MKRIIICCDGTWADEANIQKDYTNVAKTMRAIRARADVDQVVYYDAGIGTGVGLRDKFQGGMLGFGLDKNIHEAYRFLVNNYAAGDEIFLFGFSRGAYTVRSLAGLVGKIGLLEKSDQFYIPAAYQHYRMRTFDEPQDLEEAVRQGAPRWLPGFVKVRLEARARKKLTRERDRNREAIAAFKYGNRKVFPGFRGYRRRNAMVRDQVRIKFIGVWDTVGALGVPGVLGKLRRSALSFHSVRLGSHVENGYHALAIDEKRRAFQAALWDNEPAAGQHIEQVWFAGYHGNVGGGADPEGPENFAFRWMMERAVRHGLKIDMPPGYDFNRVYGPEEQPEAYYFMNFYRRKAGDERASLSNSMNFLYRLAGAFFFSEVEREIGVMGANESVHESACLRLKARVGPEYTERSPRYLHAYLRRRPEACPDR